jgi:hypothetical protein
MENACIADNEAREKGMAATQKLKLLPQVTALLEQTAVQDSVLDPEINFLQSVKYFLEPLNDGSLPAYNIQRDIFNALAKLPINKEVLLSSGIGKVVYFYTRSKRPQAAIKRIAERLVGEWSRPILKRTDDYKKRRIETRDFDFAYVSLFPPNTSKHISSLVLILYCLLQCSKTCPAPRSRLVGFPDAAHTAARGQDALGARARTHTRTRSQEPPHAAGSAPS